MKAPAQPATAQAIIDIVGPLEDAVLLQILEAKPGKQRGRVTRLGG